MRSIDQTLPRRLFDFPGALRLLYLATLLACFAVSLLQVPILGQDTFADLLIKLWLVAALVYATTSSPPGRLKVVWAFFASSFLLDFSATLIRLAFTDPSGQLNPGVDVLATLVSMTGYVIQVFPIWLLSARAKDQSDWRLPSVDSLIVAIAAVVVIWSFMSLSEVYTDAAVNDHGLFSKLGYATLNLVVLLSAIAAFINPCSEIPRGLRNTILLSIALYVSADVAFDLGLFFHNARSLWAYLNYALWAAATLALALAASRPYGYLRFPYQPAITEQNKSVFWWTSVASITGLFFLLVIQVAKGSALNISVSGIGMGLAGLLLVLRQHLTSSFTAEKLNQKIKDRQRKLFDARQALDAMSISLESLVANAPIAIAARNSDGTLIQANSHYLALASLCPSVASLTSDISTRHQLTEMALPTIDGNEKQLLLSFAKLLDNHGQKSGEWILAADVSEIKLREDQLTKMTHLATLGEITAGVAHEIKQPLNALRLLVTNVTLRHSKGRAGPEYITQKLTQVADLVERLDGLVGNVKSFGRINDEPSDFNLCKSVATVEGLLKDQLKLQNIKLILALPDQICGANGLRLKFEQVLINLINNSADAIREQEADGIIKISLTEVGNSWLMTLDDDGPGFPPALISKLTEAFFTTKGEDKGTGLGLSFSKKTLTEMGGELDLMNSSNGARVVLTIPKAT